MARNLFHDTVLCNIVTNLNAPANVIGFNTISASKAYKVKHWNPLMLDFLNGILTRPK